MKIYITDSQFNRRHFPELVDKTIIVHSPPAANYAMVDESINPIKQSLYEKAKVLFDTVRKAEYLHKRKATCI